MTEPSTPSGPVPPAGWYPDGQGGQRYWDGVVWTEHTMPAAPERPVAPGPPPPAPPTMLPLSASGAPPSTGPAPSYGAPARGRGPGALIAIIALVVVVLAGAGVAAFLVLGSSSREDDQGVTPTRAVERFLDLVRAGDCDAVISVSTDGLRADGQARSDCEGPEYLGTAAYVGCEFAASDESVDGDTAEVVLDLTCPEGAGIDPGETVSLSREDGRWKLDDLFTAAGGGSTSPAEPDGTDALPAPDEPDVAPVSPGETATAYFNGIVVSDCAVIDLLSTEFAAALPADRASCEAAGGSDYLGGGAGGCQFEVLGEVVAGEEATVDYETSGCDDAGDDETAAFSLVLQDGVWRISSFDESS